MNTLVRTSLVIIFMASIGAAYAQDNSIDTPTATKLVALAQELDQHILDCPAPLKKLYEALYLQRTHIDPAVVAAGLQAADALIAEHVELCHLTPFYPTDFANMPTRASALPNNSVGTINIVDSAVTTNKIADAAVTVSKIAAGSITLDRFATPVQTTLAGSTTSKANTLVKRDALGNFAANKITAQALVLNNVTFDATGIASGAILANNTIYTPGTNNTFIGKTAGDNYTTGNNNTTLGASSLAAMTAGTDNISLGTSSGIRLITGSNNIYLGSDAGSAQESAIMRLGTTNTHTGCYIAGINGVNVGSDAYAVFITGDGQLGTMFSSERYKHDIKPLPDQSQALLSLQPVSFQYRPAFGSGTHYGLIAEDVAKVLPELVVYNNNHQPETVSYHLLPTFLLKSYQVMAAELASCQERLAKLEQLAPR